MMWATAQTGERAVHVIRHLHACFAVMGVPKTIKTDNGPAYVSHKVQTFLQRWGVAHITGVPHNPTGQAVVERANSTLKQYLGKYIASESNPHDSLHRALYVINFLNITGSREQPPIAIHFGKTAITEASEIIVNYRDPQTGEWKGPVKLIFTGRGYSCILTDNGPKWIPNK